MFIEFLYDLLSDFSLFYFYISLLLSLFCAYHITNFSLGNTKKMNELYTREYHSLQAQRIPIDALVGGVVKRRNWLTHKTKRIEAPDDDSDDQIFSLLSKSNIKRGGQQWKINLYSLSLKNIVFLGYY